MCVDTSAHHMCILLDFSVNGVMSQSLKSGHDLLQRTFCFSDAHAVANGISSLLTVRSCRLQAYKNDLYLMPKELVEKVATLQTHSSLSVSTQVKLFFTEK